MEQEPSHLTQPLPPSPVSSDDGTTRAGHKRSKKGGGVGLTSGARPSRTETIEADEMEEYLRNKNKDISSVL